jgi:hypothetical protein
MTTLTLDPQAAQSPAAQLIAKAAVVVIVPDDKGRKITLKKPGVLAQYRLIDALGDSAKNETYVNMCLPLLYVVDVNGQPEVPLTTKLLVEALIQRLDDEGIAAVMKGVRENWGQQDPEEDKAAIKK